MGEIKKQSINNTVLSYIGAFIGFFSLLYIQPHFFGSENIGFIKLVYNFSWIIAMILPLGFGHVTMRFFPIIKDDSNKHNGYFGLLILLVTIGAILVFILFVVFKKQFQLLYSSVPKFTTYYYYCFFLSYVFSLYYIINVYSVSLFKTSFAVFLSEVYSKLALILIVFLYYFKIIDEFGLMTCYFLSFVVQLGLLVFYLYKLEVISFNINWKFYKKIGKRTIFIFAILMTLTSSVSLGVKYMDVLLLGHCQVDLKLIGIYSVCSFISAILEIPFNSLEKIAQTKIAHAWSINDTKEVEKIYEMSSRYLFFIGCILFSFLYAGTDVIFNILPNEYSIGKKVFLIISICSLFNLLTGVNTSVISLSKHYVVTSILLIVLIVVGIITSVLLIPVYGINGAAMATFIAIGSFNLLKYLYILFQFKMQPFSKHTLYIFVCIIVSVLFIYLIPSSYHPLLKAFLGCSFTVIVFSVMNMKFNTIEEVNKIFKRFKIIK